MSRWLALGALLGSVLVLASATGVEAGGGVAYSLYDAPFGQFNFGPNAVALTFDDGPSSDVTPGILDVLASRNVKATFFVLGNQAAFRPYLVQRALDAGHTIANHTWSHPDLTRISASAVSGQVDGTSDLITSQTGRRPEYFREPYGAINSSVLNQINQRGMTSVLWNVDPGDTRHLSSGQIAANAISAARPGSIIILHDGTGHGATLAALPSIIDGIRAKGLAFVQLPMPPVRIPKTGEHLLKNTNDYGFADVSYIYGQDGDVQMACDWNGDGVSTPGVFRNGQWMVRNSNDNGVAQWIWNFGEPGDVPVCGDWDGNGWDTPGVYRHGTWYLRESNTDGVADHVYGFGDYWDNPVVGDWTGAGRDSIGVHRNFSFYLASSPEIGVADIVADYGNYFDKPAIGDWNGDGTDSIAIFREATWYLRNENSTGFAEWSFIFGNNGDEPLTGDWDGNGQTTIGVTR